jgi:hypothetical protein
MSISMRFFESNPGGAPAQVGSATCSRLGREETRISFQLSRACQIGILSSVFSELHSLVATFIGAYLQPQYLSRPELFRSCGYYFSYLPIDSRIVPP